MQYMQYIQFLMEHWMLSGLGLIILAVIIATEMKGKIGGANRVSGQQAVNLINRENAKVVDIREKGAFNEGHIVNAMHATQDELKQGADKLKKFKERPILLVCAAGTHSGTIGAALHKQGFQRVYFLQGGINAWKGENMPLVKE